MIFLLEIMAWLSLAVVVYVYIGYPLLVWFLQFVVPAQKIRKNASYLPAVTLIISCFNEEKVIAEKLENSLKIDYPAERFEIIVVSDASGDRTDAIVATFADQGVRLLRQEKRLGKTSGLNLGVAAARGSIIVFSDANAMYERDAIRHLVTNFSDNQVGYVVGEARYSDSKETAAGKSENMYWRYEIAVKTMESRLHSIVGGDGAIYAIRRELYDDLQITDINDFVNPLQIIAKGFRGVYEPRAICRESSSGIFSKEFGRKVRIVNRAFSGLFRVKEVLNPFRTGLFSFEIISHKLLRWLVPFFLLVFLLASLLLANSGVRIFQYISWAALGFCWLAYIGYLFAKSENGWPCFYYPYYFILVNVASVVGVIRSLRGRVQATWNPIRIGSGEHGRTAHFGELIVHVLAFTSFLFAVQILWASSHVDHGMAKFIWLVSFFLLVYIYFLYPVILAFMTRISPRPIHHDDYYVADVAMLICAYNEEEIIEEKILNCLALDYPPWRIRFVIASDGSADRTAAIVRQYAHERQIVFYDYRERRGKIGVILETVPKIHADILLFSDANTMYAPDAVQKLVRNFADPQVGGVSADVILVNDETDYGESESLYYIYERWIQNAESRIGSIIGADGGMYAIRWHLFKAPSPNIILDDFVISMNVALQGYRLVYEANAVAHEQNVNTCWVEFLKKSRVVAGAVQAIKQQEGIPDPGKGLLFFCYFSHKLLRWHVPILMLVLFVLSMYLAWVTASPVMLLALVLQILFYALAFVGAVFSGKVKNPLLYVPFYFCLVNGAALFGLYKGYLNKQATRWQVFRRTAR